MQFEQGEVDEVGGLLDLLRDHARVVVAALRIGDALDPIGCFQPVMVAERGVDGLAGLGRFILDEPDVFEFGPHLGQNRLRHDASGIVDDDVGRHDVAPVHQLAQERQHRLGRGVDLVVNLLRLVGVVEVNFDRDGFARLVAAPVHSPRPLVVTAEDPGPGRFVGLRAGQAAQHGGHHGVDAGLVGVRIGPPLVGVLFPIPGPLGGCRVPRPDHAAGMNAASEADRGVGGARGPVKMRRSRGRQRFGRNGKKRRQPSRQGGEHRDLEAQA